MKQHIRAGLAGIAAGAVATGIAASIFTNAALDQQELEWAETATAEAAIGMTEQAEWIEGATETAAVWTQWAVDDQATQNAYATEQQNEEWDAEAQAEHDALDVTATERAFPTEVAKHNATYAAISVTEEAVALETATVSLAMTLTQDFFDDATEYARIAHDEAVEAATAEAHLPTRWAAATMTFPYCPEDKLKTNDDGSQFCEGS